MPTRPLPLVRRTPARRIVVATAMSAAIAQAAYLGPAHADAPAPLPAPAAAAPAPAPERASERWMLVEIDGARAGWARESVLTAPNGEITTDSEMSFSLARMGQPVAIRIASRFIETGAGVPVLMRTEQALGAAPVIEEHRFEPADHERQPRVVRSITQQDRTTSAELPWPEGQWVTPARAREHAQIALAQGQGSFSIRTIDPSSGLEPVTLSYKVLGRGTVQAAGKTVSAIEWQVRHSGLPGVVSTEHVNEQGDAVRASLDMGGITLTLLEASRDLALSPFSPPELMERTLVTPDRPIEDPRRAARAVFRLRVDDGAPIPDLPATGTQRAELLDDGSVRLTIDARAPGEPVEPGFDAAPFLASSAAIDLSDGAIQELRRDATRAVSESEPDRAEALRRFVATTIDDESLGVGLATASDVARTRRGDCTEHAVLLAALLRADRIPSRVVSGLVYVEQLGDRRGVFGYHMWTQALVRDRGERRWVDLDATIGSQSLFDATHIALSIESLADDEPPASIAALVGLVGRVRIEVEQIEHDAGVPGAAR